LTRVTGESLNFNAADPNSVADFIMAKQNTFEMVGGGTAVHGGFVVRLLSLLFRPFFFDARGLFGLISSLENLIFIWGFFALLRNFREVRTRFQVGLFSKYCYVFTIILTIALAVLYYNVGLGLRQRVMVYPTLLPLLIAAWAISGERRGLSAGQVSHAYAGQARQTVARIPPHRPGPGPQPEKAGN
jgi:hypothetical protein